ncbi:MAG: helix-turn-helix domain-containing protein [Oscillospiraceae bacterium]|nr:helix-turn-helix domain-containing protein [Oscillospiraceae bacterium]
MKNTDMYNDLPNILNADQLASTLGVSRARAYQLLNTANFPTLKIGKRKLVPKDKLIQWIDQHTGGGAIA